jgi:hypothetical protein
MTQEQIKAIQESFAKVVSISEQAATLFYGLGCLRLRRP